MVTDVQQHSQWLVSLFHMGNLHVCLCQAYYTSTASFIVCLQYVCQFAVIQVMVVINCHGCLLEKPFG